MNPMATSKENILQISRELIQQNGWAGINIRSVAAACGVSVGCIYNYFESKTDLLSATVESIWSDIFHHPEDEAVFQDTLSCVRWMYKQLEYGCQRYPGFFTHHALGFVQQDTADGKQQMQRAWQHILDALCTVLRNDTRIRADAFTEEFTVEKFAEMLFSLMLSAGRRSQPAGWRPAWFYFRSGPAHTAPGSRRADTARRLPPAGQHPAPG